MRTLRRTILVTAAWLVGVIPLNGKAEHPVSDAVRSIHVVYGGDANAHDQITAADAAFHAAGLELPSLEIHVHETYAGCNGLSGLFNGDGSGLRVDFCSGHPFTVLHEFAHAWEYHHVDDTVRDAFVELHDLESWRSREIPWAERGVEVAAETIAKGLLKRDLPTWQCDDAALLDEGFALLTGERSPRFVTGSDSCLRHENAASAFRAGVAAEVVQERLERGSTRITLDTYSHVLATMRDGLQRVAEVVFGP